MTPTNVLIIGSREFPETIGKRAMQTLFRTLAPGSVIISGGARGADTWAQELAFVLGFEFRVFKADWDTHGKGAGFKRNVEMVNASDIVFAFWDGESRGTAMSIEYAQKSGKPTFVVTPQ